jgi:hypothetical protein
VHFGREGNATYYRVLLVKSPILGTLEVFDLGPGIFGEATESIDAVVTIGRDDEATTAAKREAFTNKFERGSGVGGEYADIVVDGSIKVF